MSKQHKTRPARLNADKNAKPLTEITAKVISGKLNRGGNIVSYEIRNRDPKEQSK